jgi:hypothetical protein
MCTGARVPAPARPPLHPGAHAGSSHRPTRQCARARARPCMQALMPAPPTAPRGNVPAPDSPRRSSYGRSRGPPRRRTSASPVQDPPIIMSTEYAWRIVVALGGWRSGRCGAWRTGRSGGWRTGRSDPSSSRLRCLNALVEQGTSGTCHQGANRRTREKARPGSTSPPSNRALPSNTRVLPAAAWTVTERCRGSTTHTSREPAAKYRATAWAAARARCGRGRARRANRPPLRHGHEFGQRDRARVIFVVASRARHGPSAKIDVVWAG